MAHRARAGAYARRRPRAADAGRASARGGRGRRALRLQGRPVEAAGGHDERGLGGGVRYPRAGGPGRLPRASHAPAREGHDRRADGAVPAGDDLLGARPRASALGARDPCRHGAARALGVGAPADPRRAARLLRGHEDVRDALRDTPGGAAPDLPRLLPLYGGAPGERRDHRDSDRARDRARRAAPPGSPRAAPGDRARERGDGEPDADAPSPRVRAGVGSGPRGGRDRVPPMGPPDRAAAPAGTPSPRAGRWISCRRMKIAVSSDMDTPLARTLVEELRKRGHEPIAHGALADRERSDWAWASERAAREVAEGTADQGVVCCWTGTGASIAANKVAGARAALCNDAETARGARAWNDANVLAISLRRT